MVDRPRSDSHDGWVAAARKAAASVSAAEVGDAFLESLSSRRLDLRSALGSYAVGRALEEHEYRAARGARHCVVCEQYPDPEEDVNVLNFERFKWGGVRHSDVRYVAFDLEQFARAPRTGATDADRLLGREIIKTLGALPAGSMVGKAAASLRMVPSNKAEREVLVMILMSFGIWSPVTRAAYRDTGKESGINDGAVAEFLAGAG
ncbi:hypothetical protein [Actinoplanes sp. NPDC049599]|uniref:hypothetical protein n=1 Tax=Actinoplanes sp. NPDC049599 TaxID=3363903 RepID=UPI0037AB2653